MLAQPRQLEGLIRLAEARAKVDLSSEVTAEHAQVTSPTLEYGLNWIHAILS